MANETLEVKLSSLPDSPGVYQFLNKEGKVLYVGKAKNLRSRVRSYFQANLPSARIQLMTRKIEDLQLIITDTEIEALVLENTLIKELKPRYNVLLKDDKTFPFIRITNEMYPRIFPTRRKISDGSRYYGPYTDVRSMKQSLRLINQIFRIRSCKLDITGGNIEKKKFKVCLDYHIKKCDGPCEGLVSESEYKDMVNQVVKLLSGRTGELVSELKDKMTEAAQNLEFEKAAVLRNRLSQLEVLSEKQKVVSEDSDDRDVFAIAHEVNDAVCSILTIRSGKLIGIKQLKLAVVQEDTIAEIISSVLKLYYSDATDIPATILSEEEPADADTICEWLKIRSGNKVKIAVPKRGELHGILKMSKQNAALRLKEIQLQKMKKEGDVPYVLSALQRDLRLKSIPRKIECFDISNLQGTDTVASMVVFVDAKPKKSLYRKFIISEKGEPDDFESMREVITRRYKRLTEEKGELPDLIMVDGGKGQLSSAVFALKELGIKDYTIIGLAKRLEEIFMPGNPNPEILPKTSSSLRLLQQVRDEAHRFAITFHRLRRSKRTFTSELTGIKGVGPKLAEKLIRELGSVENVKNSDLEGLSRVVGKTKAAVIVEHYKNVEE